MVLAPSRLTFLADVFFAVVVQFESVLKGHGFSRAVSIVFSSRL